MIFSSIVRFFVAVPAALALALVAPFGVGAQVIQDTDSLTTTIPGVYEPSPATSTARDDFNTSFIKVTYKRVEIFTGVPPGQTPTGTPDIVRGKINTLYRVVNTTGSQRVPGGLQASFYLSADTTLTSDDVRLPGRRGALTTPIKPTRRAGQNSRLKYKTIVTGADLVPAADTSATLFLVIDSANSIPETNEANNVYGFRVQ